MSLRQEPQMIFGVESFNHLSLMGALNGASLRIDDIRKTRGGGLVNDQHLTWDDHIELVKGKIRPYSENPHTSY